MIGSGAHGDVYRGVWKTLRVAIKSITFYGPAGSAALEDYATSALSCVHANIVKTLQCFVCFPLCSGLLSALSEHLQMCTSVQLP